MTQRFDALVVGGGFAGITAAVVLAQAGKRVGLIERRGTLGGRVHSARDTKTGDMIDNGPHLMVGAYRCTRALLRDLGTEHLMRFQPRLELVMRDEQGETTLRRAGLPGDLGLALGLVRMRGVSLGDVWRSRRLVPSSRRANRDELDSTSVEEWYDRIGLPTSVRRLIFNPLCLAALNDVPAHSSAALMANVLSRTFSGNPGDDALGFITGPHSALLPVKAIEGLGVTAIMGRGVERVVLGGDGAECVRLVDGEEIAANHVIVAVSHTRVRGLFDGECSIFDDLDSLGTIPIVNIHLWLDRPVLDRPLTGLVDRPTQWVFALDHCWVEPGTPHRLVGVISGACKAAKIPHERLADQMLADLRAVCPEARPASAIHSRVIVEREATMSPAPGGLARRPGPASPWRNVWWAGDWTNTGLPSTIEGACLSGRTVAEAILNSPVSR